ncbi:MAG: DUF3800 domain-containing protein [bacterium]
MTPHQGAGLFIGFVDESGLLVTDAIQHRFCLGLVAIQIGRLVEFVAEFSACRQELWSRLGHSPSGSAGLEVRFSGITRDSAEWHLPLVEVIRRHAALVQVLVLDKSANPPAPGPLGQRIHEEYGLALSTLVRRAVERLGAESQLLIMADQLTFPRNLAQSPYETLVTRTSAVLAAYPTDSRFCLPMQAADLIAGSVHCLERMADSTVRLNAGKQRVAEAVRDRLVGHGTPSLLQLHRTTVAELIQTDGGPSDRANAHRLLILSQGRRKSSTT